MMTSFSPTDTQLSLLSLLNQPASVSPLTAIAEPIQQGNLLVGLSEPITDFPSAGTSSSSLFSTGGLFETTQPFLTPSSVAPSVPTLGTLNHHIPSSTFDTLPVMVLDLETTGLNPKKSHIIELTVIRYVAGAETARLSTLINPLAPIPPEVETLTGITPEMVKDAPHASEVLRQFVQFMTQDGYYPIICGHNIMFDLGFLIEKL
ncbi:MAG: PolC-type DNA polymerase III, partial [Vampirovibrionales bacterium]